ncbi:flagellar motor switch phosphatase FliY [bacterium (Candidatus Blackallbacteria) CG17_big_fil_post_rev_8_21_14_2_50_48_46]|uniref:Flagellar motor switch phosphatase FliY n=1 Tax=bacterium (Candidatus Blackallbacteria) CG17_big_fil_post_rev_8_21_14_2_50_48_46 TaxID=2014261 RepID=A0A2M7G426_9BACT|nr:MAG: flagellar motor switch phosphatase FliY [bacterium (Candidatus Blackallbacteria) CG18_big_fil_WC_8_21_14_2_50_49_26]PIW16577.1 MAG: flagellar motor switch phosphatase FliY [bacterium (Candidatus Blackallbacteria) CG17_big_fil_post_rev_8_21_14_2_50_48_46]PIW46085.1 MAG: flagellar motor switch phosphatase FliY [bacterium (Candidatus Blackallbacteria) CG13_big_fil_rev_8_21_14_2_50_49_14]
MGLSQEQINALLEGTGTFDSPASGSSALASSDSDFFLNFATVAMDAGSSAVSQALGKTVNVTHPEILIQTFDELQHELPVNQVMIRTGYLLGEEIPSLLLIKDYDVAVIFDILMGKDGRNPDLEISDLQTSAIGEVMNQLMGAAATALSQEYKQKLAMKAPESLLVQINDPSVVPLEFLNQPLMVIKFNFVIEGVLDSELYELRPEPKAKKLKALLSAGPTAASAAPPSAPSPQMPSQAQQAAPAYYQEPVYAQPQSPQQMAYYPPPQAAYQGPPASVRPAEFSPLIPGHPMPANPSLDRIVDIPLRVTVELGSTKLKIKNVLDLTKGSVVELDKLAGEPVDLLVNGKLMAKGEVVVINENFGVRISEILGPADRLNHLRGD